MPQLVKACLDIVNGKTICYVMRMARRKKPVNLAIDPDILARLEAWIARQELPVTKTAVLEKAILEFLAKRENAA
jgi:hypothetical protein